MYKALAPPCGSHVRLFDSAVYKYIITSYLFSIDCLSAYCRQDVCFDTEATGIILFVASRSRSFDFELNSLAISPCRTYHLLGQRRPPSARLNEQDSAAAIRSLTPIDAVIID